MRIAIMGSGGVGGYFGGLLDRAGHEVFFVARGEHLETIKNRGLLVKSDLSGDFTTSRSAEIDPHRIGLVDLILFAVKTYHNHAVIPLIKPLVGTNTKIMALQNGVEIGSTLAKYFGEDHVLPGAAYIEAFIESPGVIKQQGQVVNIIFGTQTPKSHSSALTILDIFRASNISCSLSDNITKDLWDKFVFVVSLAGPTTVSRLSLSQLMNYTEGRELVSSTLTEAIEVGRGLNVPLYNDIFKVTMSSFTENSVDLKASMQTDLEKGHALELEALNGGILRLSKLAKTLVPTNKMIYSLLKPFVNGRK